MTKDLAPDPRRGFDLLWRAGDRPAHGPKPALSATEIARAGIALADAEGIENVSMRRIAGHVGCGPMSLYRHVPGKGELLDLMLDTVIGDEGISRLHADGWRARLEEYALISRRIYERHPWILQVESSVRPTLGPNSLDAYERLLEILSTSGLDIGDVPAAASLLVAYVHGSAVRRQVDSMLAEHSGVSDEQWWAERQMFWEEYFTSDRFPTITASHEAGAFERPEDDFDFGLQRVLDGIESLIGQPTP
ncbi:MAG: TetR/AcrR family transcriptional regulator [Chloroflexota bacterium]